MARRISIIVIVSALICGGYGLARAITAEIAPASTTASDNGVANIGGPFKLTDQDGKIVSDESLKGKKLLVFFGYTSCPDVCPVTMAVITEVMNQLETAGVKDVQPVFITTDPEHDRPAVIKKYLKDYYRSFVGLTGSKDDIAKVEKEYKVYAEDSPKSDMKMANMPSAENHPGNIEHSALIYFMGADGKYLNNFNRESAPEDIVDKIEK